MVGRRRSIKKWVLAVSISSMFFSSLTPVTAKMDGVGQANAVSGAVYGDTDSGNLVQPVLIKLKKGKKVDSFIKEKGWEKKKHKVINNNVIRAVVNNEERMQLSQDDNVLYMEPDYPVQAAVVGNSTGNDFEAASNDKQTTPWGIKSIGADLTQNINKNSSVKIAVLDTGVDEHPDLQIAGGVSFVENELSYLDSNGHGTHVAGIIAGTHNTFGVVGVAPDAEIYAVKVLDRSGTGSYSQVIQGLKWAIENQMDIVSLSLGGGYYSQALHDAIKEADDAGILIVAAAGNNGQGQETETYPAKFSESVSVGAVTPSHERASFSSTGSELDLMAPGSEIVSTSIDGSYTILSGTSMAAPHVTGAASLLWSVNPEWTSSELKQSLFESATPIGDKSEYGAGLLNVAKALGIIDGSIEPLNPPLEIPPENQSTDNQLHETQEVHLYGAVNKLRDLKNKALQLGNISLAKQIEREYANLLIMNSEVHDLPDDLEVKATTLEAVVNSEEKKKTLYALKQDELSKIAAEFDRKVTEFSILMGNTSGGSSNAVISDILEPNNSYDFAVSIEPETSKSSFLSQQGDVDIFTVTPTQSGTMTITLDVPVDKDYDLFIHNKDSQLVDYGVTGSIGTSEIVHLAVDAYTTYYILVSSPYGHYDAANPYFLTLGDIWPSFGSIYLNQTQGISSPPGESFVYKFRPEKSGDYKIFTSPLGGYGAVNDTFIEVYNDAGLTNLIAYNDDANGSMFSEVKTALFSWEEIYIKVRHYSSSGSLETDLTVQLDNPPYSDLYQNLPVDTEEISEESKVFKFSPGYSVPTNVFTDYYMEDSTNGISDTAIYAYSDPNLTQLIGYNDDNDDSLFSSLVFQRAEPTYLEITGYNRSDFKARVTALPINELSVQELILNQPFDVSKFRGEYAYFHFRPSVSGLYRFHTSPYQGTAPENDTIMYLYDENQKLLERNDDANGNTKFSKMEFSLEANKDYWLKVRNYRYDDKLEARVSVEQDFDGSKETALPVQWEQIYTNQLSSIYDVDYFKVEVTESTQVHLNITYNKVTLEDMSGNIYGIFTPGNVEVFYLEPGTYFAKVQHFESMGSAGISEVNQTSLQYSVSHKRSTIEYGSETDTTTQVQLRGFDASSENDFAKVNFSYYDPHPETKVKVYNYEGLLVYETLLGYLEGGTEQYDPVTGQTKKIARTHSYTWEGNVNVNLASAWWEDYDYDGQVDRYYARNGVYTVIIAPTDEPGINHPSITRVTVINEKVLLTSMVPPPPATMYDGTPVTSNNKGNCDRCFNYFITYVRDNNTGGVPWTHYDEWSKEIYGLNGLERFWATSERFIYDPNKSELDNLQALVELGGMIPVFGELADGTNAVIYLIRGDEVNAGLSAVSMIPFYGNGVVGVKIFKRMDNITPCSIASATVTSATYDETVTSVTYDEQAVSSSSDSSCHIGEMLKYFSKDPRKHILAGEIIENNKGTKIALGFHHEPSSTVGRIVQIYDGPNELGIYTAKVEITEDGINYIPKGPFSNFFPKNWTSDEVIGAIFEVYQNKYPAILNGSPIANTYEGIHSSGVKIRMIVNNKGEIKTAFPIYE